MKPHTKLEIPSLPTLPLLPTNLDKRIANEILTHMLFRSLSGNMPTYKWETLPYNTVLIPAIQKITGREYNKPTYASVRPNLDSEYLQTHSLLRFINPNYATEIQGNGIKIPNYYQYLAWAFKCLAELNIHWITCYQNRINNLENLELSKTIKE